MAGGQPPESGSQTGLLPVPRRLFHRERDLELYLNLWRLSLSGGLILAVSLLRGWRQTGLHSADVVFPILVVYFLMAVGLHGALGWRWWKRWLSAWVVGADLLFVVAVHFVFLSANQPVVATNSQITFLGYFVVVALAAVRSDPSLARAVGIAVPASYAAVVYLAVSWRGVDMAPPDAVLGSFRWEVQVMRVLVLVVVTHLVKFDVALGDFDRSTACRDSLTGAFNRRHLEEFLRRQVRQSRAAQRPLAVLMLDLDGFKEFNDRHGHLAGDRTLAEAVAALTERVHSAGLVARYGGDEFVVVLPDATGEEARRVASNLVDVGAPGLTFSIGISCLSEQCSTAEELLSAADHALLRAKRSGGGVRAAVERV